MNILVSWILKYFGDRFFICLPYIYRVHYVDSKAGGFDDSKTAGFKE